MKGVHGRGRTWKEDEQIGRVRGRGTKREEGIGRNRKEGEGDEQIDHFVLWRSMKNKRVERGIE